MVKLKTLPQPVSLQKHQTRTQSQLPTVAMPPLSLRRLFSLLHKKSPNSNPQDTKSTQSSNPDPKMAALDPTKPSIPISFPISELADLESGAYYKSFHYPFNRASVPLPESAAAGMPNRRRILVCHDMMGGYVDDKWVQGGHNDGAYAIWHWYLMDVFVYFSHNLVTIPPPCWTNAGHIHGVKVLGTFILEWDKGAEICKTLLATEESAQMYAEKLADLASALGFDGWLINIEVDNLDKEQVVNLKEFVSHLNKVMHSSVRGSLIIWYDSVTIDGSIDYQNQLNEKNKPFFDLCDGIFVNYFWQENGPKYSAASAGTRCHDVYMGIDVFGRGTYGGGEWKTNVALDLLRGDDISAAIFAPGWVYENLPKADFESNQNRWWGLVKKSWGVLQNYPKMLPFYSNFDQGHGLHFSIKGLQVAEGPWNNISCQSFQPLLEEPVPFLDEPGENNLSNMQVFINFKDDSYSGGGNITCNGSFRENESFTSRLYQGQLPLGDRPLTFSYSVKSDGNSQMGLLLQLVSDANRTAIVLLANDADYSVDKLRKRYGNVTCMPVEKTREFAGSASWVIHESSIAMCGYTLTGMSLYCYKGKQDQEKLKLEDSSPYSASLGHISIQMFGENTRFPPADSWSIHFEDIFLGNDPNGSRTVSLTVIWNQEEEDAKSFTKYNIYVQKLGNQGSTNVDGSFAGTKDFLGVAAVERFYVSDLQYSVGSIGLKFSVQPCRPDGSCQELDECPALVYAL